MRNLHLSFVLTSVSKKLGQSASVIHYCSLSQFFWNRRYVGEFSKFCGLLRIYELYIVNMSVCTSFFLFLRCIFYFLDCWWYLEIYNWRYVEIVGNIGNFRVWSSANKCVWHTINTASRSGLKLTRPQLGQKFYNLINMRQLQILFN